MKVTDFSVKKAAPAKKKESIWNKDIEVFPSRLTNNEKELIYRQLKVLQDSGVDIRTSLELLLTQVTKKKSKAKIKLIIDEVVLGKSLSESMANLDDFSPYEVYSLQIGEETGKLSTVLGKLSEYFENQISQRRQIVSTLSYPILIVFTAIGAVAFMVFFIIPMFEDVFARFNSELPSLTKSVISFSAYIRSKGLYFLGGIASFGLLIYLFKSNKRVRLTMEWIGLRLPFVGTIYRSVYLARFSDSMGLLLQSAVPMVKTLEMSEKMIGFLHLENALKEIKKDLIQGTPITQSFSKHAIFDLQMLALIKVGEETNQLGVFFQKMATEYTLSVRHKTGLFGTFLEPFMIIFLGLVVGVILVAMYLPMFELSSSMNLGN